MGAALGANHLTGMGWVAACLPSCLQEEDAMKAMGGRGLEEIAAEPVGRPEDSGERSEQAPSLVKAGRVCYVAMC